MTSPTAATAPAPDPDPKPEPPVQPDLEDCCGNGCNPCIFDLHDMAMDRYRQALRAWRERHPDGGSAAA
jgi:Oxidoreductase-like protein, N-terminal